MHPGVHYIVGLARNTRLHEVVAFAEAVLKDEYEQTQTKQREVGEFAYAAQTWARERRVITRLEWGEQGSNPRFVVTNLAEVLLLPVPAKKRIDGSSAAPMATRFTRCRSAWQHAPAATAEPLPRTRDCGAARGCCAGSDGAEEGLRAHGLARRGRSR